MVLRAGQWTRFWQRLQVGQLDYKRRTSHLLKYFNKEKLSIAGVCLPSRILADHGFQQLQGQKTLDATGTTLLWRKSTRTRSYSIKIAVPPRSSGPKPNFPARWCLLLDTRQGSGAKLPLHNRLSPDLVKDFQSNLFN